VWDIGDDFCGIEAVAFAQRRMPHRPGRISVNHVQYSMPFGMTIGLVEVADLQRRSSGSKRLTV
jgi:hypothetical protein